MYPNTKIRASFSGTYKSNKSQMQGVMRLGGEISDAGFGSIRRVLNCRFSALAFYDL